MKRSLLLLLSLVILISTLSILVLSSNIGATISSRTYTDNADFDEGALAGVEHETVANQLQLSKDQVTLPFIWIANSGEDTVSKIDTVTGKELGRYRTGPGPEDPSRTTVDINGDLWVGNRASDTAVKIALYPTDQNGDSVITTSSDLNNDGIISGSEVLPWGQDEAVLLRIAVDPGPRALAVDASNNVWIGGYGYNMGYYNGQTGAKLKNITVGRPCYGALIDAQGTLWISNDGSSSLTRIDNPSGSHTMTFIGASGFVYGLGIDTAGYIYTGGWDSHQIRKYDPINKGWVYQINDSGGFSRGVAIGLDGDLWVAHSYANTVTRHNASNGSLKATIGVGDHPTGVAVDAAGKVWVTNYNGCSVMRINPASGGVDFTQGGHLYPYNYSDMTGIISRTVTTKTGTWSVVFDSEEENMPWGTISWSSYEPDGTSVTVKVKSSNDQTTWSTWEDASNGVGLTLTPDGRYLQVETTLRLTSGDVSPILYDLTVEVGNLPPEANAGMDQTLEQTNHAGAEATLDGSGSIDDGQIQPLTYTWAWAGGSATGINPTASFPLGTTTVTLTVFDGQLFDTDTVDITVQDTTPPSITCPEDITVEQGTADGTAVTFTCTATDICDADPTIVCDPLSGTVFPLGTTSVICTATDDSGNQSSCSFTVTVVDTTPPSLKVSCIESTNPHGNIIPGKNRGKNGQERPNQNPDGFYELSFDTEDTCDAEPETFVGTADNPLLFAITSGIVVKFTESRDAVPEMKPMGSNNSPNNKGQADAVSWHIILPSDPVISSVDDSGNIVSIISCVVPPPPM